MRTALAGLHENRLFRVLALASLAPPLSRTRPSPAPGCSAQGTRQTVAPPVRSFMAYEATADEPRLTLEFPVGPKVELRAFASN